MSRNVNPAALPFDQTRRTRRDVIMPESVVNPQLELVGQADELVPGDADAGLRDVAHQHFERGAPAVEEADGLAKAAGAGTLVGGRWGIRGWKRLTWR